MLSFDSDKEEQKQSITQYDKVKTVLNASAAKETGEQRQEQSENSQSKVNWPVPAQGISTKYSYGHG